MGHRMDSPGQKPGGGDDEMVPRSRLNEVQSELKREREQREAMILGIIENQGRQPQATEEEGQEDPLAYIEDEDIRESLRPAFEATARIAQAEALRQVTEQYGPALNRAVQETELEVVGNRIGGGKLSPEMVVALRDEYSKLDPSERDEYDNRVGAEALTLRVLMRGMQDGTPEPDLGGMAQSTPFGNTPSALPRDSSHPSEDEVFAMTDEEWADYKAANGL